jgi:EAL domain-containing protein (putative c-di-GMP-specific phosphodiesterase class I)
VAMGTALGMQIVAEGVETAEQAAHLRLLGCHTAQGYLFSAPQLPATLGPLLARSARATSRSGVAP